MAVPQAGPSRLPPPPQSRDLYLVCTWTFSQVPQAPNPEQTVALLLQASANAHSLPFSWKFVDRPQPGTCMLVYHNPNEPVLPTDGVRYLHGNDSAEQVSRFAMPLPANVTTTYQASSTVDLEVLTLVNGFLPPTGFDGHGQVINPPAETHLARFRRRFRLATGGAPGLVFVYWGTELNQALCPPIPKGWEREPIRRYPLPPVNDAPVYPYSATAPPTTQGHVGQPQPSNNAQTTLAARQAQAAQHAHETQVSLQAQVRLQQAAASGRTIPGAYGPPPPVQAAIGPSGRSAGPNYTGPPTRGRGKVGRPPLSNRGPPPSGQAPPPAPTTVPARTVPAPEMEHRTGDILDITTARQLAISRFSRNHAFLSAIFDAWSVEDLLQSFTEEAEAAKTVANSVSLPPPIEDVNVLKRKLDELEHERKEIRQRHKDRLKLMKMAFEAKPLPKVLPHLPPPTALSVAIPTPTQNSGLISTPTITSATISDSSSVSPANSPLSPASAELPTSPSALAEILTTSLPLVIEASPSTLTEALASPPASVKIPVSRSVSAAISNSSHTSATMLASAQAFQFENNSELKLSPLIAPSKSVVDLPTNEISTPPASSPASSTATYSASMEAATLTHAPTANSNEKSTEEDKVSDVLTGPIGTTDPDFEPLSYPDSPELDPVAASRSRSRPDQYLGVPSRGISESASNEGSRLPLKEASEPALDLVTEPVPEDEGELPLENGVEQPLENGESPLDGIVAAAWESPKGEVVIGASVEDLELLSEKAAGPTIEVPLLMSAEPPVDEAGEDEDVVSSIVPPNPDVETSPSKSSPEPDRPGMELNDQSMIEVTT